MNETSMKELSAQLLAMQAVGGHRQAVCGLLTDGFSGTVVLLRAKARNTDAHAFLYLLMADSLRTLFHYFMLATYMPVKQLEELLVAHAVAAGAYASCVSSATHSAVREEPAHSAGSALSLLEFLRRHGGEDSTVDESGRRHTGSGAAGAKRIA